MFASFRFGCALTTIFWMTVALMTGALAVTVEVAKKCDALTAKAFPPRVVGNPAAGSTVGTAKLRRAYFLKCVADEEKIDKDKTNETTKPPGHK